MIVPMNSFTVAPCSLSGIRSYTIYRLPALTAREASISPAFPSSPQKSCLKILLRREDGASMRSTAADITEFLKPSGMRRPSRAAKSLTCRPAS